MILDTAGDYNELIENKILNLAPIVKWICFEMLLFEF